MPPTAISRHNVRVDLIGPEDLRELASRADLHLLPQGVALRAIADAVNEAFSNYANGVAIEAADSPSGPRRDWCAALANGSTDLMRHLGYQEHSGALDASAFDAMASLKRGWPNDPQTPAEHELLERLNSLLLAAVPDKYVNVVRPGGERDLDECWMSLLGRIGSALVAVALVARSAEHAWSAETSRGGSDKDRSRRYLIETLVDIFACLFGRRPESTFGSAGYNWFSSLIERAGRRAAEQRGTAKSGSREEIQARTTALEAIEAIARHIALRGDKVPWGQTKLDHWLREALEAIASRAADGTRKPPRACPAT